MSAAPTPTPTSGPARTPRVAGTPEQTLHGLRVVWCAMLASIVTAGALVFFGVIPRGPFRVAAGGALATALRFLPIVALALALPIAYFARLQAYKRGWVGHVVTPAGYAAGNLILMRTLAAIAIGSLLLSLTPQAADTGFIAALAAAVALVINFPNGRPMHADSDLKQA